MVIVTITSAINTYWREELKQKNLVAIGSQYYVGVVAHYQKSESIMVENIDIDMPVILSLKKNNKFHFLKL